MRPAPSRAVVLAAVGLVGAVVATLLLAQSQSRASEMRALSQTSASSGDGAAGTAHLLLPDDTLLGFVEIPGGVFLMGSSPERDALAYENERWTPTESQGRLDLPTFFIGRYEVTVSQFQSFLASSTHQPLGSPGVNAPADHPVSGVSWPDALAYSAWLQAGLVESEETPTVIRERLLAGWKVSLPTEAQWEKAARGADGRIFPWGDELRVDRANFQGRATRPVGSYPCPECAYPLSDMSGNVWEWTRSPLQPYPFTPADDEATVGEDALWVMRGGAFNDPLRNVRAATRGGADPGARRPFLGFRVVLTPE